MEKTAPSRGLKTITLGSRDFFLIFKKKKHPREVMKKNPTPLSDEKNHPLTKPPSPWKSDGASLNNNFFQSAKTRANSYGLCLPPAVQSCFSLTLHYTTYLRYSLNCNFHSFIIDIKGISRIR